METENKNGEAPKKDQSEQNNEKPKTKNATDPKTYSSGEMWTYGGIGALITGLLGYFIGQAQGEKKAKRHYEYAIEEWRKRNESKKASEGSSEKFRLE